MAPSRSAATLLASCAIALSAAAPSTAVADDAVISHVKSTRNGLELLVSVPADAKVDLDDVTVSVEGAPTISTASSASSTTTVRRTAVLVIDTSNSMSGARFDSARTAALTFLDTVPDDVYVGVVSFDGDVTSSLEPSRDREAARAVVAELELGPRTRLHDGILAATAMAGGDGQRSLLVLSDGADTSDTELRTVTARVRTSEVLLDVVSLEQQGAAEAALLKLARAGRGRLIDADPEALQEAFTREAAVLARQIVVTAKVPASVTGSEASITVTLPSTTGTLTAEAFAPIRRSSPNDEKPPAAAPPTGDGAMALSAWWLYAGLGSLAVGILAVLLLLLPRAKRELTPADRAATYTDRLVGRDRALSPKVEPEPALAQARDAAGRVLERNRSLEARIALRLEAAGSALKPAEWLLLHTAIFLGAGMLGILLGGGSLLLGILFLVLGAVGPWMFLGFKRSRRRRAFATQLPDTLQLMSGSLAAGLSLAQSVDTIVREGAEPVSSEFRRVLVENRLGIDLEDALGSVAERIESKDFGWVVMAIRIQRQVGGNLAELLDSVAATMREREYVRRQVAALSAEGKLSAWVLGGLPPLFMLYLLMTNRDYVIVMFTEPVGWAMLTGAGMLLALGVFWMSRLIKVEI